MTAIWRVACLAGLLVISGCGWDNRAPIASSLELALDEDTFVERPFPATDADDDALRFEILTPPEHGTLVQANGSFAYTPAPDYNGPDHFDYRARDIWRNSGPATITIAVRPVNDRPTAADVHVTTLEDQAVTFTVTMRDIDGDATTLGGGGPSQIGPFQVLDPVAGTVRFTPDADRNGVVTAFLTVSDGTIDTTVMAEVTVTPVNDAPVARDDVVELIHGTSVDAFPLSGDTDVDQEPLFLQSVGTTPDGRIVVSGNRLTFTPNPDCIGVTTVSYEVADAAGALATAQIRFEARLAQAVLFLADRDTSGTGELYRYDGIETRKLNLPLAAGERILDFKSTSGAVVYRTRQAFTNHLYRVETGRFAPAAERVSTSSVDEYYLLNGSTYYLSGNTLYAANTTPPIALFTPSLPGTSITGVVAEGGVASQLDLSTVQFNPGLGSSSVLRSQPVLPFAVTPLVTLNAPDWVTRVLFAMQPSGSARSIVYSAEVGGARAIYQVPAAGGASVRLSPSFGLGEFFSAVEPHPFDPYFIYRGNLGSTATNVYRVDLAQPGVHRQINARNSASEELTAYTFNQGDQNLFYAMSDASGTNRRVYLARLNQPGFASVLTPSMPGTYGAYELASSPRELRLLYLDAATAAGPSRLMMLDDPTQGGAPVPLRDAGAALEQLRVGLSWSAATVLERGSGANSLLLVNLLAPGDVRVLHSPRVNDTGVLEARFEQP